MKKIFYNALIIALTFNVANAQEGVPMPPVPVVPPVVTQQPPAEVHPEYVQFKELEFDFGNIIQGTPASHIFEFKNVGNRVIDLQNVGASCGCTTPNWKGGPYKPGETGQITATYNAASEGYFNKTITVTTSEGSIVLTIKGNVMNATAYNEWKVKDDAEKAEKAKTEAGTKAKAKAKGHTKGKAQGKAKGHTKTPADKPKTTTAKPAATKPAAATPKKGS
ncbi:MAG: DUF1573 domain-containing protein [Bacteroidota bacterium]